MKKLNKVLSVIMIALMLTCACTNVVSAFTLDVNNDKTLGDDVDSSMNSIGSTILTFITNAAMVLAVVLVAILGIKYMMGSVEEKAEYKKSMVPYLVGAICVFGAGMIGKAVASITF